MKQVRLESRQYFGKLPRPEIDLTKEEAASSSIITQRNEKQQARQQQYKDERRHLNARQKRQKKRQEALRKQAEPKAPKATQRIQILLGEATLTKKFMVGKATDYLLVIVHSIAGTYQCPNGQEVALDIRAVEGPKQDAPRGREAEEEWKLGFYPEMEDLQHMSCRQLVIPPNAWWKRKEGWGCPICTSNIAGEIGRRTRQDM